MKLKPTDIAKFPAFAYYVRINVPQLVRVPSVVHNLKTKGNFADDEVAEVLKWNSGPFIKITDLSNFQCGVASAWGCTRGSTEIEIDTAAVQDFETGKYSAKTGKNARHQSVYIVGVTLLHELCHLGKFRHSIAETKEAGGEFEKATYGKMVP